MDVRVILREAILSRAASFVLCHNHPSGSEKPSHDDDRLTQAVATAGKAVNIRLLDHVIIAGQHFYSYGDEGRI